MSEYDEPNMSEEDIDELRDAFRKAQQHADDTEAEYMRLAADPCMEIPEVGDTVIVAAGLIGMGFHWIREEAEVLAVGQRSVKVHFLNRKEIFTGKPIERWVATTLITDVIRKPKE